MATATAKQKKEQDTLRVEREQKEFQELKLAETVSDHLNVSFNSQVKAMFLFTMGNQLHYRVNVRENVGDFCNSTRIKSSHYVVTDFDGRMVSID